MQHLIVRFAEVLADLLRRTSSPMASLDRSIAAAGYAHVAARRALAIAVAEETRETSRREALTVKVIDMEKRAIEAIRAGREDLAVQASEVIASVTTEINTSQRAAARFAAEVALARREVDAQRRRLADLDRGRRLAKVDSALNDVAPGSHYGLDSFAHAEAALAKVNADNLDARAVREEMAPPSERLIEHMSDAGFGDPIHVHPADVMAKLRGIAINPQSAILIESVSQS